MKVHQMDACLSATAYTSFKLVGPGQSSVAPTDHNRNGIHRQASKLLYCRVDIVPKVGYVLANYTETIFIGEQKAG